MLQLCHTQNEKTIWMKSTKLSPASSYTIQCHKINQFHFPQSEDEGMHMCLCDDWDLNCFFFFCLTSLIWYLRPTLSWIMNFPLVSLQQQQHDSRQVLVFSSSFWIRRKKNKISLKYYFFRQNVRNVIYLNKTKT